MLGFGNVLPMKRFGPPLKDRRDKKLTERSARERFERHFADLGDEPCPACGAPPGHECEKHCGEDQEYGPPQEKLDG